MQHTVNRSPVAALPPRQKVRISAVSPKATSDAAASSSLSALPSSSSTSAPVSILPPPLRPMGSPVPASSPSAVFTSGSQRPVSSNGQLLPDYETWSLQDYAARNAAGRKRFWENAPSPATKGMVRMILELAPTHPTRRQAVEKGWLAEEEKVN